MARVKQSIIIAIRDHYPRLNIYQFIPSITLSINIDSDIFSSRRSPSRTDVRTPRNGKLNPSMFRHYSLISG